ncbi:PspC domain-containing protein [Rhodococcus sp. I2R]|uniref:PspC domain-containing protein n=1 Tax=Rhodococcus sp. I2R TaxID=2855445 RepID=UPI001E3CB38C|nr:PspC domain-containing protein [Rhodococcus sp. I2R]MCC8929624.1 PspC domain-containing protein [Rhodococcus sp. I2R]
MSNATVSDQLQHMWRTRPYRLPQRGHIAGVAAGIGYRYGIDPVLVRVALVVGTIFGGAGIVLYLAAWLLFSKAGDTASPAESLIGKGGSSDSTTKVVVLIVALVIVVSTIGPVGVGMGGSGLISMVALLAGWWLLYQRRPEPPEFLPDGAQAYLQQGFPISFNSPYGPNVGVPNSPWAGANYRPPNYDATRPPYTPYTTLPSNYVPNPSPAAPPEESTSVNLTKDTGESAIPDQPTPPSWDPLGVAPFAWDLPEPASAQVPEAAEKKHRSRWTTSFIGLALVAAAVTAGIAYASDSTWLTPARIGAVALAVVAVGLILGAFLRRGYGLLVVTGPLLAFVVLASIVGPISIDGANSGEQRVAPTTLAELQPSYAVQLGDLQLDLLGLELTEDATVEITVAAGNATVIVPSSMNVLTECTAVFGSTSCEPESVRQRGNSAENTHVLTIDGNVQFGNLEVIRE